MTDTVLFSLRQENKNLAAMFLVLPGLCRS